MALTELTLAEVRIEGLIRISQAIETAATLDELLLLSLHALTQLFEVQHGGVILLNDEGQSQVACEYPPQPTPFPDIAVDRLPMLRYVLRKRRPLQVRDGHRSGQQRRSLALLHARQMRSALLVPLVAQDMAVGALVLGTPDHERRFGADEIALMRVLASQIATALAALRVHEQAQRRSRELATLNEIASTITSTLDTHEVYRLVVQKLSTYFNVEAGSLLLIDEQTGDLEFVMTIEGGEEKLAGVRVPMGQGVVGHVAQTHQWEIVRDAERDPRFYRKVSEDIGFVTRSILCVPMIAKGRTIGAIELLNKLDGNFTSDEAERLMRMAAFIGVALENARLFQQVADGRDRLAAILNSTTDAILMTDMYRVVLTANPMAERLFELDEDQMVGRSLDELLSMLHQQAQEIVSWPWNNSEISAERGDAPIYVSEIELRTPQHRFIRHLAMAVRDVQGEVYGQLAVFRDISQEKELEQLRNDWTSMLVHDLRAPLTSIMNGIMMVNRGVGGPVTEQQQELLQIAHQGSQTMLELVNNLLDISKMEQGHMTLDIEPLDPYRVADQAMDRLSVSARSQRVSLEQRLAQELPLVEADSDKIVRVIQNLLDNAIKFSPSGSSVTVGTHIVAPGQPLPADVPLRPPFTDGEWLVFWVQDRGVGIPPAYHERIFERFGQVRGRKLRGTGLGLTFCKLAVEAHSGQIWVESEEGRGSVFAFGLPLKRLPEGG